MTRTKITRAIGALDRLDIEIPSWGFADTGTRFGKFYQEAAAIDLGDKLADAGHVNRLTGCCPKVAVHVLWDFQPNQDPLTVAALARSHGVQIGSINPNLFQNQEYKHGSFANPDPAIRQAAIDHVVESIELGRAVESDLITLWFPDGTNYPGQDNMRARKRRFEECLASVYSRLGADQSLLIEYKPFEPAFYQTDVADWGMSYALSRTTGPKAKVLVDTGHHYPTQNIEQIVAFLLDEEMLGGFHFNDRRYADDDLTLGSIDPYQIFRIFHEIHAYAAENGGYPNIAYMIDQSHNIKPKIEAMIQTVMTAQELFAKAALVNHKTLAGLQGENRVVDAEELLRRAFMTDVTPALSEWRRTRNLAENPLLAHRESKYEATAAKDRRRRRSEAGIVRDGSYV